MSIPPDFEITDEESEFAQRVFRNLQSELTFQLEMWFMRGIAFTLREHGIEIDEGILARKEDN